MTRATKIAAAAAIVGVRFAAGHAASEGKHYVARLAMQRGRELSPRYYLTHCYLMPDGSYDISYNGPPLLALRFTSVDEIRALHAASTELSEFMLDVEAHDVIPLCTECRAHAAEDGYGHVKNGRQDVCHGCWHWLSLVPSANDLSTVRVNAHHYQIAREDAGHSFRGFGGSEWFFEFNDGRRVRSTNVWTQGVIPPYFRERLPDNARIVRPPQFEPGPDRVQQLDAWRKAFVTSTSSAGPSLSADQAAIVNG